ncbi:MULTISPECIES: hypothetical protein [unclassified Vibrio]|uniref:hypothetical protein n=1 Tax=unclassified Vibrio TaxID=2614977 RepID=UPI0021CFDB64|nr:MULTISPECIES: hypothetical protein [unclassified Vibrio]MDW1605626.1 hypothetical protein [Vibrio sp. Vb2977]MDW1668600.1 hypothetical protein [Vibrio sp. Vb2978]MDW1682621.1 hypothetical protein [Vibrio sp. Vb2942]
MAKIKVHAGDFLEGEGSLSFGVLNLKTSEKKFMGENILLTQLESVELASEENVKKIGGTIGWGAAGALVLGPAGLLAGLLLGGKKKDVTFVALFKDGRKLLATTDSKSFTKLQAAVF